MNVAVGSRFQAGVLTRLIRGPARIWESVSFGSIAPGRKRLESLLGSLVAGHLFIFCC